MDRFCTCSKTFGTIDSCAIHGKKRMAKACLCTVGIRVNSECPTHGEKAEEVTGEPKLYISEGFLMCKHADLLYEVIMKLPPQLVRFKC